MHDELQPLLNAVQRNCHISDARHAGDYTLCVYLLKMREYFRWEQGYRFRDSLPESEVGDWLKDRENFWQSIEEESFIDLPMNGNRFDPFDNQAINAALNPHGLIYSGGLGNQNTPHFFLGKLHHREKCSDYTVLISEIEYARDLTAPPAMSRDGTIFIRRESLRRMIWEKIEEWRWNKLENPMGRAIHCFDLDNETEAALEQMTDSLLDSVLLHEQGELLAGKSLGSDWEQMLVALPRSKTEIMIRAVRDHLADSLTTLPALVDQADDAALHFYFANLTSMRKEIFPALMQAYETWVTGGKRTALENLLPASQSHWQRLADRMLEIYRDQPADYARRLQALIEDNQFHQMLR